MICVRRITNDLESRTREMKTQVGLYENYIML